MKKRIIAMMILISVLTVSMGAYAESIFPPQRPDVGVMKLVVSDGGGVVIGLRTNGTLNIMAPTLDPFNRGFSLELKEEILSLTDIVDVACTFNAVAALKKDGTVYVGENEVKDVMHEDAHPFEDAKNWTDIVALASGTYHLVGLKSDGTVVSAYSKWHDTGAQNVSGWSDVVSIYANKDCTIAVTKRGKVLVAGKVPPSFGVDANELMTMKNVESFSSDLKYGMSTDGTVFPLVPVGTEIQRDSFGTVIESEAKYVPFEEHLKECGLDINIVDVESVIWYETQKYADDTKLLVLDDKGDVYEITFKMVNYAAGHVEKAEWKKIDLEAPALQILAASEGEGKNGYYILDENGRIWSFGDDATAFSSSDWVLTTNIVYKGKKLNSDVSPFIINGRTLAPIRVILEALGMEVSWNSETMTALAVKGEINIKITIDSNIAVVNDKEITLDVPAQLNNSRTFVPVRFFAEALGMSVDWDNNTQTVYID